MSGIIPGTEWCAISTNQIDLHMSAPLELQVSSQSGMMSWNHLLLLLHGLQGELWTVRTSTGKHDWTHIAGYAILAQATVQITIIWTNIVHC